MIEGWEGQKSSKSFIIEFCVAENFKNLQVEGYNLLPGLMYTILPQLIQDIFCSKLKIFLLHCYRI